MKVWVDIANSPHVTLFNPVVEELRRRGHDVVITVWDRGQTRELAEAVWPEALVVGDGFRRSIAQKGTAIWARARALAQQLWGLAPEVAVSHNSYSQILAGRALGIRVVTAMDYEHQPANHLAFRLAHRIVLPDVIPLAEVRRFGATPTRIVRYSGLKEEVALSTFQPDPEFRRSLGVPEDQVLVTVRPPAEGALYHRSPNPVFEGVLPRLGQLGACVLLSPRTRSQAARYGEVPGVRVLARGVSGLDLLFHSDVVIGAGGTMTREAAVLGTPVFTVFSGRPAAVDRYLIRTGRLRRLDVAELLAVSVRRVQTRQWRPDPGPLYRFVDALIEVRPGGQSAQEPSSSAPMSPAA
jgi:predicted glycosyltransferase